MKTDNYSKHTSKNPLKQFFINNFFNSLFSVLKDLQIDTVLDVGCGEGFTLSKLKENKIGKKYEGIDASREAIYIGKKQYPELNLKEGNIYKLDYKDNSLDLVICTEVLEHLENPEKALRELLRVSKKYLIISVPNEPFFYLFNYTQWGKDIGHINKWTSRGFTKLVKRQKVKILKIHTPFPWTMVFAKKS